MNVVDPAVERPALAGAKLRTQRAAQHLQELETIIGEFQLQDPNPVVFTADRHALLEQGEARDLRIDWSRSRRPPSKRLGIVAGETLYNLRAALDYLVFALAWLDSGRIQEQTQFPIADSGPEWRNQAKSRLPGVSSEHKAALQRYQPFEGCEWTRTLRDLSNPDKHRSLTSVFAQFEGEFRVDRAKAAPVPGEPTRVTVPVGGQTVGVYFWNETPVFETLKSLAVQVATTLAEFQGDFGEADVLHINVDEKSR